MLFRKKNKSTPDSNNSTAKDKIAKGIAGLLLSFQNRFASFMSEMAKNLTKNTKQLYLLFFCVVFGGLSLYAFVGAFSSSGNSGKSVKPEQISIPKYFDRSEPESKVPMVSERDIKRMDRFKKYMDSLSYLVKGRAEYDSILKARPGLMDSIKAIEQLYYLQLK